MTSRHPQDEILLAYLDADLGNHEDSGVEDHLRECDLCVSGLMTMQPRLAAVDMLAMRVPASVVGRAAFQPQSKATPRQVTRPVTRRPPFLLRWPVLIPTSLAAGVLLGLSTSFLRQPDSRMTRSVDSRQATSVAAVDTALRRDPATEAVVVANLPRGEEVKVVERRPEWILVERVGGEQGWVRSEHLR